MVINKIKRWAHLLLRWQKIRKVVNSLSRPFKSIKKSKKMFSKSSWKQTQINENQVKESWGKMHSNELTKYCSASGLPRIWKNHSKNLNCYWTGGSFIIFDNTKSRLGIKFGLCRMLTLESWWFIYSPFCNIFYVM